MNYLLKLINVIPTITRIQNILSVIGSNCLNEEKEKEENDDDEEEKSPTSVKDYGFFVCVNASNSLSLTMFTSQSTRMERFVSFSFFFVDFQISIEKREKLLCIKDI